MVVLAANMTETPDLPTRRSNEQFAEAGKNAPKQPDMADQRKAILASSIPEEGQEPMVDI
jgi:hypothetical protein